MPVISSQTETVTGAVSRRYFSRSNPEQIVLNRKQGNNFPEDKSNSLLIFQIINASEHGCLNPQFSIVYVKTGLKHL